MRTKHGSSRGFLVDERRLKYVLAAFFLALAIPSVVLVAQAYRQLKWEAFRQTQLLAEELAGRIDADLRSAVAAEEARSFSDYRFLVVEGDAAANFVQRSPLSAFPVESAIPGAIGYFQVDTYGVLTTPLLPESGAADAERYGISAAERLARLALEATIRNVLVGARDAPPSVEAQAAFDRLRAGAETDELARAAARNADFQPRRIEELGLAAPSANLASDVSSSAEHSAAAYRQKRVEQELVPEPAVAAARASTLVESGEQGGAAAGEGAYRVHRFESELDPFEVGLLDTGHIVMFRDAWRDGQRYIQGLVVDRERFVAGAVEPVLAASSLDEVGDLILAYGGNVLAILGGSASNGDYASGLAGTVLHRVRMSPPFSDVELLFRVERLPRAPGSVLLGWVTVILAVVLCGGVLSMYRFGAGQIRLSRQQQDFVSAVSHELKTPLTSIRMYGEMLKAGWAEEAKKPAYYEYIHSEAERLSRLIENVLQLARLTRNGVQLDLERLPVAELLDFVRSKIDTQVERAGFGLELRNDAPDAEVSIDADCFAQVMINLVDNALKFSTAAERKVVEITCRRERDGGVLFTVRDFGPGIAKGQLKRIFELFYRPPNELTRETVGTGIGLALVRQLVTAMNGRVEARNCSPGAEFRLSFDAVT